MAANIKARIIRLEKQARAKRAKPGRPPLPPLDLDEMGRLVMDGNAKNSEIALHFGVDDETIKKNYSRFLDKKRAERRVWLRSCQTKQARLGNSAMLIWLGKQELDQADRQQQEHSGEVQIRAQLSMEDLKKSIGECRDDGK